MQDSAEITIETGVQMPRAIRLKRYNFESMLVGDSMFFELLTEVESAQSAAYGWASRHNKGFRTTRRKVEGGYRLWRIA